MVLVGYDILYPSPRPLEGSRRFIQIGPSHAVDGEVSSAACQAIRCDRARVELLRICAYGVDNQGLRFEVDGLLADKIDSKMLALAA